MKTVRFALTTLVLTFLPVSVFGQTSPTVPRLSQNVRIIAFDRDLISRVRMSPDGRYVFTYLEDVHFDEQGTVIVPLVADRYWQALWDTNQSLEEPAHILELGDRFASDAWFSPDSTTLAIKTGDTLFIYALPDLELVNTIPTPPTSQIDLDQNLTWTDDGRYLAMKVDNGVFVYDFVTEEIYHQGFVDQLLPLSLGNGFWIIEPQPVPQPTGRNTMPVYNLIICTYTLDQCQFLPYENDKTVGLVNGWWIYGEYSNITLAIRREGYDKPESQRSLWLQVWQLNTETGIQLIHEYPLIMETNQSICPRNLSPTGQYVYSDCGGATGEDLASIVSLQPFEVTSRFSTGAANNWFSHSDYIAIFDLQLIINVYHSHDSLPISSFDFSQILPFDKVNEMVYTDALVTNSSIQITENDDLLMFNLGFAIWLIPIEYEEQ